MGSEATGQAVKVQAGLVPVCRSRVDPAVLWSWLAAVHPPFASALAELILGLPGGSHRHREQRWRGDRLFQDKVLPYWAIASAVAPDPAEPGAAMSLL